MNTGRFLDLFQRISQKSMILEDVLWTSYQRMVVPVGPVSGNYVISSKKYQDKLFRFFKECILIRSGSGFVTAPDAWYSVVCDRSIDLSDSPSKLRNEVQRGLKNCIVKRIEARFMAEHAWPVHVAAFRRYKNARLDQTERQFKRHMMLTDDFDDILHYWGVFEKETGQLMAYAKNYVYGKMEAHYWMIRFHPDFLRLYPSYALLYEMNKYYLGEEKFGYVNDGFRSLLHETNVQDYLIDKFFFRKQPIGLRISYRPYVGQCMSLTYPYKHFLGKMNQSLAALYKLEEINRGG